MQGGGKVARRRNRNLSRAATSSSSILLYLLYLSVDHLIRSDVGGVGYYSRLGPAAAPIITLAAIMPTAAAATPISLSF